MAGVSRRLSVVSGLTLIVLAVLWYFFTPQIKFTPGDVGKPHSLQSLAAQEDAHLLHSFISTYDLAAVRLFIEATPLRRVELEYVNEEDDTLFDESLVLLDKVIVIPKDLQPQTKHIS